MMRLARLPAEKIAELMMDTLLPILFITSDKLFIRVYRQTPIHAKNCMRHFH